MADQTASVLDLECDACRTETFVKQRDCVVENAQSMLRRDKLKITVVRSASNTCFSRRSAARGACIGFEGSHRFIQQQVWAVEQGTHQGHPAAAHPPLSRGRRASRRSSIPTSDDSSASRRLPSALGSRHSGY